MVFLTFELATYAASCLTIISVVALIFKRTFTPRRRRPPAAFRWPIIGNATILMSKEPHKTFLELTRRHGGVFTLAIGPVGVLCLTKYEVIKEALARRGDIFSGRPRFYALGVSERGYNGIVLVDGEGWKTHRRFALQTLKEFGVGRTVIEDKITSQTDHLRRTLDEFATSGRTFRLAPHLELCVSNVLADLVFGQTFDKDDEEFRHFLDAVDESFKIAVSFGSGLWEAVPILTKIPLIRKWVGFENMQRADRDITAFIRKRMRICELLWDVRSGSDNEPVVRDFTTAFLKEMRQRQAASSDGDAYFNEQQWLAVVNDLWVAGIETTMVALNWIFFYVCLFPDSQWKVQQEIDCVVGRDRAVSMGDKPAMPSTQAFLSECLRFANMIPFNILHRVNEHTRIAGYDIPAGTWVLAQICAVLWDPEVFPNPDCFRPERFLDEDGRMKNIEEFIPFSIGKRACLGESLAKAEMFLIVTQLLQKYTFRFPDDQRIPCGKGIMGLTKRPNPYQCIVCPRS